MCCYKLCFTKNLTFFDINKEEQKRHVTLSEHVPACSTRNNANVMAMQARQIAENISANKFWALRFYTAY
jgi:hypothetical protein